MASYKVFTGNQILAVDRGFAKAQMATGDSAALFTVILEITLNVQVCIVTNDLDAVLVCTNRAIRTQTPELAGNGSLRNGVDDLIQG